MNSVEDGDITKYLEDNLEQLDILKSINNPKETMQYLIPYTNLVTRYTSYCQFLVNCDLKISMNTVIQVYYFLFIAEFRIKKGKSVIGRLEDSR